VDSVKIAKAEGIEVIVPLVYSLSPVHTDEFYARKTEEMIQRLKPDRVMIKAVSVEWKQDLSLGAVTRELIIPWKLVEREVHDRGCYIIVLKLVRDRTIEIGARGAVRFRKGFYLYVGSAARGLTGRVGRHRVKRKRLFWLNSYI
jgi:sugar fermentation stimulation protein A